MSAWDAYKKTMVVNSNLWLAAKANDVVELAALLAAGENIDACDSRGYAPLMLAAYAGNVEAFDFLLARGASPDTLDGAGNSVLMGAAFKGHTHMVKALLRKGVDVSRRNHAGMNARGFAEMFGRAEVAALLAELSDARTDQARAPAAALHL